jgi:hypothetical protein
LLSGKNKSAARPRDPIDRRRSLASVPILNQNVSIQGSDEENWVLVMKLTKKKSSSFLSRFTPKQTEHRFELDELGTFVVKQLDGRNTVERIIERFVERFKVNRREAELSVVEFLKTLTRKRIISIAVK